MNALRKQFEREKGFDPYNNAVTRNDYIAWLEARLEQKINGRNIIVENYKKQLESKAAANEEKVREDVIKKAYIAGVEDCFVPLMVKTTIKMKIKLEELYANFKTANPSLFAEEHTEQQKSNDPYSPYAAWITPQQVYEAQQKQKNAESVDDICIKCKHHGTFDVYCDECTDTNDNYQPKTKEE